MTVPLPNHPPKEAQKRKEDGRPVGRHVLIDDVVSRSGLHQQAFDQHLLADSRLMPQFVVRTGVAAAVAC